MSALRLLPHNATVSGTMEIGDEDITSMMGDAGIVRWGRLRAVRWSEAAIIFQGGRVSNETSDLVRR